MGKVVDISGVRYGRLVVLEFVGLNKYRKAEWRCLCDCGSEVVVLSGSLSGGLTKSCGCLKVDIMATVNKTHGMSYSKEYLAWARMKERCSNPNNQDFPIYSALGMSENFRRFESFLDHIGEIPQTLQGRASVDRIVNSKGYFEGNVRWANDVMQNRNKSKRVDNSSGVTGVSFAKDRWVATWTENGKVRSKSYSVSKYGYDEAFEMACTFRMERLLYLNSDGAGYSDTHGL